jgi:hypothetical protein
MQESAGGLGELFSELDKNAGVAPKKWIQVTFSFQFFLLNVILMNLTF